MIEEKDFILRLIRQIIEGLARSKRQQQAEVQVAEAECDDDTFDLDEMFEETTGLSRSFFEARLASALPGLLFTNPDAAKIILTARLLIGKAEISADGEPFYAAAATLLEQAAFLPIDPALDAVRHEAAALLRERSQR